jgi:hypothetical protein
MNEGQESHPKVRDDESSSGQEPRPARWDPFASYAESLPGEPNTSDDGGQIPPPVVEELLKLPRRRDEPGARNCVATHPARRRRFLLPSRSETRMNRMP